MGKKKSKSFCNEELLRSSVRRFARVSAGISHLEYMGLLHICYSNIGISHYSAMKNHTNV